MKCPVFVTIMTDARKLTLWMNIWGCKYSFNTGELWTCPLIQCYLGQPHISNNSFNVNSTLTGPQKKKKKGEQAGPQKKKMTTKRKSGAASDTPARRTRLSWNRFIFQVFIFIVEGFAAGWSSTGSLHTWKYKEPLFWTHFIGTVNPNRTLLDLCL